MQLPKTLPSLLIHMIHTMWRLKPWSWVPRIGVNLLLWENLEGIILWPTCMLHNGCMTIAPMTNSSVKPNPNPNVYHNPYYTQNQKPKHWSIRSSTQMKTSLVLVTFSYQNLSLLLPPARSYHSNYMISHGLRTFLSYACAQLSCAGQLIKTITLQFRTYKSSTRTAFMYRIAFFIPTN